MRCSFVSAPDNGVGEPQQGPPRGDEKHFNLALRYKGLFFFDLTNVGHFIFQLTLFFLLPYYPPFFFFVLFPFSSKSQSAEEIEAQIERVKKRRR